MWISALISRTIQKFQARYAGTFKWAVINRIQRSHTTEILYEADRLFVLCENMHNTILYYDIWQNFGLIIIKLDKSPWTLLVNEN